MLYFPFPYGTCTLPHGAYTIPGEVLVAYVLKECKPLLSLVTLTK